MKRVVPHFFTAIVALVAAPLGNAEDAGATPVDEALRRMRPPPGFEVMLFAAEPNIVQPIAQAYDDRGRLWVLECLEFPRGAAKGGEPRDRVKILEDADGDGHAEKVRLFAKGFDLATGLAVGYGGVFVGEAPRLLFVPDRDGDDVPDGPPEVLLEGWGREPAHQRLNSFTWGPDGWLYGCQGESVRSEVRGIRFSAGVWRYHPRTKAFEVFAEGTSNPWGIGFDDHGQAFVITSSMPHLFHVAQGGLYSRRDAQSSSPHAYGAIAEVSDHLHYEPGRSKWRSVRPETSGGGHVHAGALVYSGEMFPEDCRGSILMGNIHGSRINRDVPERRGSTYRARHAPDLLAVCDFRFRPVSLAEAPDGAVTILDWHDARICPVGDAEGWDRASGRVYKLAYRGQAEGGPLRPPTVIPSGGLRSLSSRELVRLLERRGSWWHGTATRILAERQDASVRPELREMALHHADEAVCLRALWALEAIGGFDENAAFELLASESEWIRSWTVRFLGDSGKASEAILVRLAEMARRDASAEVRRQLASTCRRLKEGDVLPIILALALHEEDAGDAAIPLFAWLALEPRVVPDADRVVPWLEENAGSLLIAKHLLPRAARRLAADGGTATLAAAVKLLRAAHGSGDSFVLAARGIVDGLDGRRVETPEGWSEAYVTLRASGGTELMLLAARLGALFKAETALPGALAAARNQSLAVKERMNAIETLSLIPGHAATATLEGLWNEASGEDLAIGIFKVLAKREDASLDRILLRKWSTLPPWHEKSAIEALSSREAWAVSLLRAVERGDVHFETIDESAARRMAGLGSDEVTSLLERVWGRIGGEASQEITKRIEQIEDVLRSRTGSFDRGGEVFAKRCAKCHALYGKGHNVGPQLDRAPRDDVDRLVRSIVNPNDIVAKAYYATGVLLGDGQLVQGIIAHEDAEKITLRREEDALETYPRSKIRRVVPSRISMMPEGLANDLKDDELRDLFTYVVASPPFSHVRVAGPFRGGDDDLFDTRLPPEGADDPLASQAVAWRFADAGSWGKFDLVALGACGAEDAAVLYAEVEAPGETRTELEVDSSDPVKVWLNGREVSGSGGAQGEMPRFDRISVTLPQGTSRFIFKVVNRTPGRSVFQARLVDPDRRLKLGPGREP